MAVPHEAWLLCRPVGTGWGLCVTVYALGSRHADQNLAFHVATLFSGAAADPGHTCTLYTEVQALQAWSQGAG